MADDIWRWFDGEYIVHCASAEIYQRVMRWKKSRHGSVYLMPDGPREYDVIIPEEYVKRARLLLASIRQPGVPGVTTNRPLNDNDLRRMKRLVREDRAA